MHAASQKQKKKITSLAGQKMFIVSALIKTFFSCIS